MHGHWTFADLNPGQGDHGPETSSATGKINYNVSGSPDGDRDKLGSLRS